MVIREQYSFFVVVIIASAVVPDMSERVSLSAFLANGYLRANTTHQRV
jgi:hypothetical protein